MEAIFIDALMKGVVAAGLPCLLLLGAVMWLGRRQEIYLKMVIDNLSQQVLDAKAQIKGLEAENVKLRDQMFDILKSQRDQRAVNSHIA